MTQDNILWWFSGGCCLWHFGLIFITWKIAKKGSPVTLNNQWKPKALKLPQPNQYNPDNDDEVYQ